MIAQLFTCTNFHPVQQPPDPCSSRATPWAGRICLPSAPARISEGLSVSSDASGRANETRASSENGFDASGATTTTAESYK